jgi:catechol 2,3-dioxygenase-like lactoylglutathione lyase family enzyme
MRLYMTELTVSDFPAAVEWWSRLLGCGPSLRDDAGGFALFEVSGGRVALKCGANPGGGTVHFEVDELPAGEVKASDEGYRRVKLTDPDGNVAVLFQWVN